MTDRLAKDALFDGFAAIAKALGSGRRAELVDVLAQGERSVDQLAGEVGQTLANTSQHLQVLARTGLVQTRREGTRVIYSLAGEDVARLWGALRDVAARQVAGFEGLAAAYVGDRSGLEVISREELLHRLAEEAVVVLDVRPPAEFAAGHVPGAWSVPPDELLRRLDALPPDVEIVAYCRGRYCVYADEAVRALQDRHVRASRLEDGFPEWRQAGLPVERGSADVD